MEHDESNVLPDLIVDACPLGCTQKCDESWINQHIAHRIICKCRCHHKKQRIFDGVLRLVGSSKESLPSEVGLV